MEASLKAVTMHEFCRVLPKAREKEELPKRKFRKPPTEVLFGVQTLLLSFRGKNIFFQLHTILKT